MRKLQIVARTHAHRRYYKPNRKAIERKTSGPIRTEATGPMTGDGALYFSYNEL